MDTDLKTSTTRETTLLAENARLRQLLASAGLRVEGMEAEASAVAAEHLIALDESRQETRLAREDTRQAKEEASHAATEHQAEVATHRAEATRKDGLYADLRTSEGRLRLIMESASDFAIFTTDLDGRVTEWNAGAQNVLGWEEAEIVGQDARIIWTSEDREAGIPEQEMQDAREQGRASDERWHMRHDGNRFWASGDLMPLQDEVGRLIGYLKILRDRTEQHEAGVRLAEVAELLRAINEELEQRVATEVAERVKAENQLRQSQKMEAVGQLTGGLAHDFNNLLTGISGSLELLSTRLAQGRLKDLDRYVTVAQGASKRAAALTHWLLAFSRQQTLDPKATDANRLVNGMEEMIRRTVGPAIELEVVGAGGLWPTLIDPPQLENALLNLCINARDAMPDGGRLTIETGNRWLDERGARERDLQPGQYVSLCVSDTGTGMSPDVIAKAFDPFFTTKPLGEGTGLGLSMIYGFARQSGGQTRIHSEVGQGTTVCLYLPRHFGEMETVEATAGLSDAPRSVVSETVLVVDDEPTIRMLVNEVLKDLGYTTIEAADGPSGLRVLQSDVRIDLLVSDVGLPGGLNGRQMADAARVSRPGLKVLFITGYAENAVVGNGYLDQGMQVMTKPFAIEALASRIREMIVAR